MPKVIIKGEVKHFPYTKKGIDAAKKMTKEQKEMHKKLMES